MIMIKIMSKQIWVSLFPIQRSMSESSLTWTFDVRCSFFSVPLGQKNIALMAPFPCPCSHGASPDSSR